MCKPLIECLNDKTPAIRSLADEVILSVMPLTGYSPFQTAISSLKPAVQQTMKPILEKIKAKVGTIAPQIQTPAEKLNSSLGAP